MINLIWDCTVIIHNEELNDLPNGADWPPRKAAVEAIESLGLSVHSVSSGWGCDESTPKIASLKRRVAMLENECVEKYSRIKELEKELSSVIAGLFSENELAIRDLEQQTMGRLDGVAYALNMYCTTMSPKEFPPIGKYYADQLKGRALKEQE